HRAAPAAPKEDRQRAPVLMAVVCRGRRPLRATRLTGAGGCAMARQTGAVMIFTVAIDGPAAAGKGTISRAVAERFGLAHLDTGLLYRAVGVKGGDPVAAAQGLTEADLQRDDLRTL